MEFIRFFQSGGPFMYAILAIMALGLAITVDRFLYLNRTQKKAHRVWEKVSPMLRAEDYSRAAHALTEMTGPLDRKSTRLNSSHVAISYAVFCWKQKNHTAQ